MFFLFRQVLQPIFTSLSPNVEKDDVWLALKLIFMPWKWKKNRAEAQLEKEFQNYLGVKHSFAFNSGRSAFLAILNSLKFTEGDEILLQAFTCNAAVNPILWSGLKPVFVDIVKETLNLDPEDLKKKISKKSRAILVQHTFGLPADLERIQQICQKHNLILIEDCAHALGAEYKGRKVGTFGRASFFSLGRDKVISSIYGGIAVTDDDEVAKKIKQFQENCQYPSAGWIFQQLLHPILTKTVIMPLYHFGGLGRLKLLALQKLHLLSKAVHKKEKKGEKPNYFPQKMPNALALLALCQFKKLDRFNQHRQKIATFYDSRLPTLNYQLPLKTTGRIYMRYPVLLKNGIGKTDTILRTGRKQKIFLDDGWRKKTVMPPDTVQEKMGYKKGSCPVAEKAAQRIINLPTHINIKEKEAERIIHFCRIFARRKM